MSVLMIKNQSGEWVGVDTIQGLPGNTPIKGVDYYTPQEVEEIKQSVTPVKGVDYFDGATPEITASKLNGVTSIKVDGQTIAEIADGQNGVPPTVTASKSGNSTTIYVNGQAVALIKDGEAPVMSGSKNGKVNTISANGVPLINVQDGEDGGVSDVQINGTSIIENGVANITSESVETALGYEPADADSVGQLSESITEIFNDVDYFQNVLDARYVPDEELIPYRTFQTAYISENGNLIVGGVGSAFTVDCYMVEDSKVVLFGDHVRLGHKIYPICGVCKEEPQNMTLLDIIIGGTDEPTNFNKEYNAHGIVYLLIAKYTDYNHLSIATAKIESNVLDGLTQKLDGISVVAENEVEYASVSKLYIDGNGRIETIGSDNFVIYYFPVKKGEKYKVVYNRHAFNDIYGAVAFAKEEPKSKLLTDIVVKATTSSQNIDVIYSPIDDGYLFVQKSTNSSLDYKFTIEILVAKTLKDKPIKIQTFGDSITDNVNNTWQDHTVWCQYLDEALKGNPYTLINSAYGGGALHRSGTTSVYERVCGTGSLLQTDNDIVVVWAGTNDWAGNSAVIGDLDSDPTTIIGAVKGIIEYIHSRSNACIIFATPMQRYNDHDSTLSTNDNGEPVNGSGLTLKDVCRAIKSTCDLYGIDCIEMDKMANFNKFNIRRFASDGLHPSTKEANLRIAKIFVDHFKQFV